MKEYGTEFIRNVALVGHLGSGKTSLVEALLYDTGTTTRLGKIEMARRSRITTKRTSPKNFGQHVVDRTRV